LLDTAFYVTLGLNILAASFNYGWDIWVDFGLLRTSKPGKRFLRNKLMLPRWFYYWMLVSNFIMRFIWVPPMYLSRDYPEWFQDIDGELLALVAIEVCRRG